VQQFIAGKTIKKDIVVPKKLVNIAVGQGFMLRCSAAAEVTRL